MKKIWFFLVICCLTLFGCGGTGTQVSDPPPLPKVLELSGSSAKIDGANFEIPGGDGLTNALEMILQPKKTKERFAPLLSAVKSGEVIYLRFGKGRGGVTYQTRIQLKDQGGANFSGSLPYAGKFLSVQVYNLDTGQLVSDLGIKFVFDPKRGLLLGIKSDILGWDLSNRGAQDAYMNFMAPLLAESFGLSAESAKFVAYAVEIAAFVVIL